MQPHSFVVVAALNCGVELRNVRAHEFRVQGQWIPTAQYGFAELPPDHVDQLLERVPSNFGSRFRPEIADELIPCHSPSACGGERGEERQATPLQGNGIPRLGNNGQAAERFHSQHRSDEPEMMGV